MKTHRFPALQSTPRCLALAAASLLTVVTADAQLIDRTLAPNPANEGIAKSYADEIGAGRGDIFTPGSSAYIIARDPFRSVRRGRQLFQRKFTRGNGLGPLAGDGIGDVSTNLAIGAGLSDSCSSCHGRPRGSAGFGGDVATRPDSRDAPHLFGLGLKEMLADEITAELRAIRAAAITLAQSSGRSVTKPLVSKGIRYGAITVAANGSVNTSAVEGVDVDLRVKPFFFHGGTISIREFVTGALNDEMGLQAFDPTLAAAKAGGRVVTPTGMVLDGALDAINAPRPTSATDDPDGDGVVNEVPQSIVDHFEFYLLNYFKPGTHTEGQDKQILAGRRMFELVGCARCHIPDLTIEHDRRVADVETVFDEERGIFNGLFATATPLINAVDDGSGHPALKQPKNGRFVVKNILTDFKRHDLGPRFHERNYDGTMRTHLLTTPLWGVGSTAPYGHDGRSINLNEVILRHGGEAQPEAEAYARLGRGNRNLLLDYLNSLVIFPPDDTASNLNPGNRADPKFPQSGHGSLKLGALFNDPNDPE